MKKYKLTDFKKEVVYQGELLNLSSFYTNKMFLVRNYKDNSQYQSILEKTHFIKNTQKTDYDNFKMRLIAIQLNINEDSIHCCECNNNRRFVKDYNNFGSFCSTKCSSNNSEVRQKTETTNIKKYGTSCSLQNPEVKQKTIKTFNTKYNTNNPMKCKKIIQKVKQTNMNKYGVENAFQLKSTIDNSTKSKINRFNHIKNRQFWNDKEYIIKTFIKDDHFLLYEFTNFFNCGYTIPYHKLKELNINHSKLSTSISYKECYFRDEITKINKSLKVIHSLRNIITPYEIDIFLPDYNIGIEYNGKYWHSTQNPNKTFLQSKYQHHKKSMMCKDKGIQLFHVYEDINEDEVFDIIYKIINYGFNKEIVMTDNEVIIDLDYDNGLWLEKQGYYIKEYIEPQLITDVLYNSGYIKYRKELK